MAMGISIGQPPRSSAATSHTSRSMRRAGLVIVATMLLPSTARAASSRGPISVPIGRRSPLPETASVYQAHRSRRRRLGDGGGVGAVVIDDCENMEYTATVGLGTPTQDFKVVLNTGNYWLWVSIRALFAYGGGSYFLALRLPACLGALILLVRPRIGEALFYSGILRSCTNKYRKYSVIRRVNTCLLAV